MQQKLLVETENTTILEVEKNMLGMVSLHRDLKTKRYKGDQLA